MRAKILLTVILSLIAALSITLSTSCASEPLSVRGHPTSTGTAPKRLAIATVTEIQDSVLTVKIYNVVHTVLIDNKTKITRNGKLAVQSDIKPGMRVGVTFIEISGNKVATAIAIRSDALPEAVEPKPALPQPSSGIKTAPALRK